MKPREYRKLIDIPLNPETSGVWMQSVDVFGPILAGVWLTLVDENLGCVPTALLDQKSGVDLINEYLS